MDTICDGGCFIRFLDSMDDAIQENFVGRIRYYCLIWMFGLDAELCVDYQVHVGSDVPFRR